ncbi:MAG: DNA polymerase III subunit beta [Bacteroidales bacterium]|nr:DNA polymerase III subunit beta [Bacteroidales bacterium]
MRFIINSQYLSHQLQSLSGVLTTNNMVPIINCFLFHIEEGELSITATDTQTTMVSKIALEKETSRIEGIDTVAVPSKLILDILKTLDDVPMTFAVDEKTYAIEITSGEGRYSLAGQNPETFPTMPVVEETTTTHIPASVLVNAINKTSFAASTDDTRPQMTGIFVEMAPDSTTFVATDAHKLVRYHRADVVADESTNFILPRKPITLVKNILASKKEETDVTIQSNNVNVTFTFDNFYVVCRLVEGRYPNVDAVIPKESPCHLTVDRMTFLNVLRRVSLFASKSTYQVRLSMTDRELSISAEDIEFSNNAHEKMACEYEGDPMEIGFNAKFLIEMVSNLDTENILINMSHPSRPGVIFPINEGEEESKEDILMLVMPVMLANA